MQRIIYDSSKRNTYIIIYDISDDKRRQKVSKFLESYGKRIQMSAFEIYASNKTYEEILHQIPKYMDKSDDIRAFKCDINAMAVFSPEPYVSEDFDLLLI